MAVRHFDGIDDEITVDVGAVDDFAAYTWATIVQLAQSEAGGLITARTAGSVSRWHVNPFTNDQVFWSSQNGGFDGSGITLSYAVWMLLAVSKPSGANVARFHFYNFDTDTWSHADGDNGNFGSLGADVDTITHGTWDLDDEYSEHDLAVTGVWDSALSDGALEGLTTSLDDWVAAGPAALWAFNQADVGDPVLDLTEGGADQTAIVGTTVVTDDDPPGFDFGDDTPEIAVDFPIEVSFAAELSATNALAVDFPIEVSLAARLSDPSAVRSPVLAATGEHDRLLTAAGAHGALVASGSHST